MSRAKRETTAEGSGAGDYYEEYEDEGEDQ